VKKQFINQLRRQLKQPLPGIEAQSIMMVSPKPVFQKNISKEAIKPSAVLIILFFENNSWNFFLTKRSQSVSHHKGQISLPGGKLERGESLQQAALRESEEEIGIISKNIHIIGALSYFNVPVSNFKILPFIGWIKDKPNLKIHDKEVEKVFSISIEKFILKSTQKTKYENLNGRKLKIPYFDIDNEIVWGATSIILSEFKRVILNIK
tara:strand:- start:566 stop:1189 length:624 start_codon:yes stop_codon:yes gene_type:complete